MFRPSRLYLSLVAAMLLCAMLMFPAFAAEDEAQIIRVGETHTVNITKQGEHVLFRFTPEHTATYIFRAESDGDTYGMLLDSNRRVLVQNDDADTRDFEVRAELQAGEVYYWVARYKYTNALGSFAVSLDAEHTYEKTVLTPWTCTEAGLVEYQCSDCGSSYTAVAPAAHDWAGDSCARCGLALVDHGQCGDAVFWHLTGENCLILSGFGKTWDYQPFPTDSPYTSYLDEPERPAPWREYYDRITRVELQPGITGLGESLFWSLTEIQELVLPEGVRTVGRYALNHCSGIRRLQIPSTVQSFADWYLQNLNSLEVIQFDGAPPVSPEKTLLNYMPDGLLILYHSSAGGWDDAMEKWEVPEGAQWYDLDQAMAPQELTFLQTSYTLTIGQSIRPATNADPYVDWLLKQWSYEQEDAALITGDMVTGLRPGTVTITAASDDGSYSASCTIEVVPGENPDPAHWRVTDYGLCGDQVAWCLMEDGSLILSGYGKTWDFLGYTTHLVSITYYNPGGKEPAPWQKAYQQITAIEVSEGITYLGEKIFWCLYEVPELTLPEGMISMGQDAISYCVGLKKLNVSSTVKEIGWLLDNLDGLQVIQFDCPPFINPDRRLLENLPKGLAILFHGSQEGWDQAVESWPVPYGARWLDLDAAVPPESLAFAQAEYTIPSGQSLRLSTNADPYVNWLLTQWSSDQESVALVSDGVVTALRPGSATIQAASADGTYRISCTIHVTENTIPDSGRWALQGSTYRNEDRGNYLGADSVIFSYLTEIPDDTLERVQYHVKDRILMRSRHNRAGELLEEQELPMELPIFGGFFAGSGYNFLLYGQNNPEESDEVEVLRIVRYTKDWQRLDHCSVYGVNTTVPFRSGTADFAEAGGKLVLHTSHMMYTTSDGLNHQANMTFVIDIGSMTVADSWWEIMNISYGYVSHSFSQRVRSDGTFIFRADHGDGHPRGICITRVGIEESITDVKFKVLLEIPGEIGDNATGVSLGGMELSPVNCLVVGNSVDLSDPETYSTSGVRNIFVCVTDQALKKSETFWLTDYPEDGTITARTPQFVKITDNLFLIAWEEYDSTTRTAQKTRLLLIDGNGTPLSQIASIECHLSDCRPIVTSDGMVRWFAVSPDLAELYGVNWYQLLTEPEALEQALSHQYAPEVTAPTCTEGGFTTYTCLFCDDSYTTDETAPLGHQMGEWTQRIAPTCTLPGRQIRSCLRCGEREDQETEALGHDMGEWTETRAPTCIHAGEEVRICSRCDHSESQTIATLSHSYTPVITEPTCTEEGYTTYICSCRHRYVDDYVDALGHDFGEMTIVREPTCYTSGQYSQRCVKCYYTYSADIPPTGHTFESVVIAPTCTDSGYTVNTCTACRIQQRDDVTEALGHDYDNGICTRCGKEDPSFLPENPFGDVAQEQWYFAPVLWAVERGITTGTSATTFSPDQTCTRAQVVTFLWRAMGEPEPKDTQNPFTDVTEGVYYHDAVLWAVEQGITSGTGNGLFSPDRACTRDQVVTFLWRAMGKPAPGTQDNPFTDVPAGVYYYEPVLWAVEQGVTSGTSKDAFSPGNVCTRGQVVTFLFRALAKD